MLHQNVLRYDYFLLVIKGSHDGSGSKETAWKAGDLGLIPGLGRSPGGWNGNPL